MKLETVRPDPEVIELFNKIVAQNGIIIERLLFPVTYATAKTPSKPVENQENLTYGGN